MQEECGSFPADSRGSFLNVMHSLSLLPNNCPKDQQPDEQERFTPSLVESIIDKKQLQGPPLGHAQIPFSVQLLTPTWREQTHCPALLWLSGRLGQGCCAPQHQAGRKVIFLPLRSFQCSETSCFGGVCIVGDFVKSWNGL